MIEVSQQLKRRGLMLVLSSPSGAGKTSIARHLLAQDEYLSMSVSATTRPPRHGEVNGQDYFFLTAEEFGIKCNEGAFLEYATVFGHEYGTPRQPVLDALAGGRDVLFDIDWQGTQQLQEAAEDDVVKVFILPPSAAELEKRLARRAQDSASTMAKRMEKASDEISHYAEYDYIIVNEDLDASVAKVLNILHVERMKRARQIGLSDFITQLRASL